MSATGRNLTERAPFDYYPTPAWCVRRLLDADPSILRTRTILEPCAGDGAIIRALRGRTFPTPTLDDPAPSVCAWEIQERFRSLLTECASDVIIGDSLKIARDARELGIRFDIALTNPPFGIAMEMLQALWPICDRIVFLLRMPFLASEVRQAWVRAHVPDLYVLPNRPIFHRGQSDNADYAWMSWEPNAPRCQGNVEILDLTPREERTGQSRRTDPHDIIASNGRTLRNP